MAEMAQAVAGPRRGHAPPQTLPGPLKIVDPEAGGSGRPALCKVLYLRGSILTRPYKAGIIIPFYRSEN